MFTVIHVKVVLGWFVFKDGSFFIPVVIPNIFNWKSDCRGSHCIFQEVYMLAIKQIYKADF